MSNEKSPAGGGAMERAYCALEMAALDLDRRAPLFSPFAEMQEWNEAYRRELILSLIHI